MPIRGLDIVRAALPRRVPFGDRVLQVPPPTVQDALEVLYGLQHREDETDDEIVLMALSRWLPDTVTHHIMRLPLLDRLEVIRDLVLDGAPEAPPSPPPRRKRDAAGNFVDEEPEEKEKPAGRQITWADLFVSYCHEFRCDIWESYIKLPFPVLVAASPQIDTLRALETMRQLEVVAFPNLKKKARQKYQGALLRRIYGDYQEMPQISEKQKAKEMDALEATLFGGG